MPEGVVGRDSSRAWAELDGTWIALSTISSYHCHDRDLPAIRCFEAAGARDADIDGAADASMPSSVPYTQFYRDENYGGGSFTAYNPIPSLTSYGWNDQITSFKSLNNGRPRWYRDADFGPPSWRWSAGALVPNVGSGANDGFSSVENDP